MSAPASAPEASVWGHEPSAVTAVAHAITLNLSLMSNLTPHQVKGRRPSEAWSAVHQSVRHGECFLSQIGSRFEA